MHQAIRAAGRRSQGIGDVLRHGVIGEALAEVQRLVVHRQFDIFVPGKRITKVRSDGIAITIASTTHHTLGSVS